MNKIDEETKDELADEINKQTSFIINIYKEIGEYNMPEIEASSDKYIIPTNKLLEESQFTISGIVTIDGQPIVVPTRVGIYIYSGTITYYIDSTNTDNTGKFSKIINIYGWPVGLYRVDLNVVGYLPSKSFGIELIQVSNIKFDTICKDTGLPCPAEVYMLGNLMGTTPLILNDIRVGYYSCKITKSGYEDIIEITPIIPGWTTIISETLNPLITVTPTIPTGYLYISSTPLGTEIYIDGTDQHLTTPTIIPNLSPGAHTYRLVLDGYKDDTGIFDIISWQITIVHPTLIKLSKECQSFNSVPVGAKIFINDTDMGAITPSRICRAVPIGEWSFRLDGTFTISSPPSPACQSFNSVPKARIFIDDIDTGFSTPRRICDITPETHTFSLRGKIKVEK